MIVRTPDEVKLNLANQLRGELQIVSKRPLLPDESLYNPDIAYHNKPCAYLWDKT